MNFRQLHLLVKSELCIHAGGVKLLNMLVKLVLVQPVSFLPLQLAQATDLTRHRCSAEDVFLCELDPAFVYSWQRACAMAVKEES